MSYQVRYTPGRRLRAWRSGNVHLQGSFGGTILSQGLFGVSAKKGLTQAPITPLSWCFELPKEQLLLVAIQINSFWTSRQECIFVVSLGRSRSMC